MRRLRLMSVGAAGAIAGLAVLFLSGVINVASYPAPLSASVTDWVFGLAVRQSVTLRSAAISVPDLDDPALVERAAGHYDLVCAACHGAPGKRPHAFAARLSPSPPLLVEQMSRWRPPARVFWTVKHGVRQSAMPAWPSQVRDDEVWAMVAFLETLPELSPSAYAEIAGDAPGIACARCHAGKSGIPRLDIQSPEYIAHTLRAFRDSRRVSGTMMSVARTLGDDEIESLAQQHGLQTHVSASGAGLGREIAERGIPDRKVPACQSCHGDGGRVDYPRLAGQDARYLFNQLRLFKTLGVARGGRYADIMAAVARLLSEEEMADVASWYGQQARPTSAESIAD